MLNLTILSICASEHCEPIVLNDAFTLTTAKLMDCNTQSIQHGVASRQIDRQGTLTFRRSSGHKHPLQEVLRGRALYAGKFSVQLTEGVRAVGKAVGTASCIAFNATDTDLSFACLSAGKLRPCQCYLDL